MLKNKEKILSKNRRLVRANLKLLSTFFSEYPESFEWEVPDGGCVAYPRFLGIKGVENFCQRLIQEAGVLLLPSSIYRSELLETPKDRFRIGFGREGLEVGLNVMREFIGQNQNQL